MYRGNKLQTPLGVEKTLGTGGTAFAERQLIASSMVLLPVAAAGVLLIGRQDEPYVAAASDERAWMLEQVQVDTDAGPCLLVCRTGQPLAIEGLDATAHRWPVFARRAADCDYRSVYSLPLRFGGQWVGALNLFRTEAAPMSAAEAAVGQELADSAAIGVIQRWTLERSELLNQQLQNALDTRVIIEQAKGILAERASVDISQAFTLLRTHARRNRQRLVDLALAVVDGADTTAILNATRPTARVPLNR